MEILKRRKYIIRGFAFFLIFIFLCSMISRGIYASDLPQIETAIPQKSPVVHEVFAQGSIYQGHEKAFHVTAGLRIQEIYVHAGETVTAEDALFLADVDDLQEKITEMERSVAKLELQISDMKANAVLDNTRKATVEARAQEDYHHTVEDTSGSVSAAEQELKKASDSLRAHKQSQPKPTSDEERSQKNDSYQNWSTQKDALSAALTQAQSEKDAAQQTMATLEQCIQQEEANGADATRLSTLRDALRYAVSIFNQRALAVTQAANALTAHDSIAVPQPDFSAEDASMSAWEAKKKELEAAVMSAAALKQVALDSQFDAMTSANRILEDSLTASRADSSIEINELTLASQTEELQKYKEVLADEGKIYADTDGIITVLQISVGDRTSDIPVLKLADLSKSLVFTTTLTKDQRNYINQGDIAALMLSGSSGSTDVTIDYIQESAYMPGSYLLTVYIPEGVGYIGQSAVLNTKSQSQSYTYCIPLQAIHTDENKKTFVYILKEKDTILGKELAVMAVDVEVLEQNDYLAAISSGSITSDTEIVITSTKEISDGTIVRYKEP